MPKKPSTARAKKALATSNRPLRLEYVQAKTLALNPANWRMHPDEQLAGLKAVLDDPEIGWAGALLYNERTKRLIDGHGRLDVTGPDEFVPVLIGSWTEAGEQKILLTLDPLGAMAAANAQQLDALRAAQPLTDERLAGLRNHLEETLKEAQKQLKAANAANDPPQASTSAGGSTGLPDQFKIIITCRDEMHQTELLNRFDQEGIECKPLVG